MRELAHVGRRLLASIAAGFLMLLNLAGGAAFVPAISAAVVSGHMTPAIGAFPKYQLIGQATTGDDVVFNCQRTNPAGCYGPKQIQVAYNIKPLLDAGITGKGHTIVIIDAFQSPTIEHDLHLFDQLFGLPDPNLTIVAPDGLTPFDPNDGNQVGWAGEITLDVEWAHAVAPDANITLVLAPSNQDDDILSVTRYAVEHRLGDVISQSFGEGETCVDPALLKEQHKVFQQAAAKHITVFASSGDQGAAQPTCDGTSFFLSASSPASDPLVTAVGGTRLFADGLAGTYQGEIAWNEQPQIDAASGGGFSTIYTRPGYQERVPGIDHWRGVPDVAYNGAVIGGVLTVWSSSGLGQDLVFRFGGTSAGSPQWAGITALADQKAGQRLGFLNKAIYSIGKSDGYARSFHDITSGDNSFTFTDANNTAVTITGYNAGTGWDPVTGWGSPNVDKLVTLLIQRIVEDSQG